MEATLIVIILVSSFVGALVIQKVTLKGLIRLMEAGRRAR
jgi:hypothetical protein